MSILLGDNLQRLVEVPEASIDLIYADPPFNSGEDYNLTVEVSMAQQLAFGDTWGWTEGARQNYDEWREDGRFNHPKKKEFIKYMEDIKPLILRESEGLYAYLAKMGPRILELHRVLTKCGSMYLHCDPTASHYLKQVMDIAFGVNRFLSEIIWKRTSAHNNARRPGPVHDVIFLYSKSERYTWNKVLHDHTTHYQQRFDGIDDDGRKWVRGPLTGAGTRNGESGLPWNGVDPNKINRHWAIPKAIVEEYTRRTGLPLEGATQERLDKLSERGLVLWPKKANGVPRYKQYLTEGVGLQDVWTDIPPVNASSEEWVEFDTQKPIKILDRIIQASSNEGDVVLDPYCGSGTTLISAGRLRRKWIGIEFTKETYVIAHERLVAEFGSDFEVSRTIPADIEAARNLIESPIGRVHFEKWVVMDGLGGTHTGKSGDDGVDGYLLLKGFADGKSRTCVIQVKSGGVDKKDLKEFKTTMMEHTAAAGLFVCWRDEITQRRMAWAAEAGVFSSGYKDDSNQYARIQFIAVEDLFDRRLERGGARLPGFVVRTDPTQTRAAQIRNQQDVFNLMMTDFE